MLLRNVIIFVDEMNFPLKISRFPAERNLDEELTFARWCTPTGQKSRINIEG
ncbi:hypothetical protein B7P43_G10755 [Cryptotermes secundus]|uniref:Uncharacterized protein n=1 Tax=Cryptotermes secundus TaxID=105785 RepID=A0A2J7RAE7_9NEOP|nr:hypothetical protein B7P43_G10755 [Cryptotermes secundus]